MVSDDERDDPVASSRPTSERPVHSASENHSEPTDEPRSSPSGVERASDITTDAGMARYVRKNLARAVLSLVLVFAAVGFLTIYYQEELREITTWVFERVGLTGLAAVLFVTDAFASPFPPDTLLLLVAQSEYRHSWFWLIPLLGALSTCAGLVGWFAGTQLAETRWPVLLFGRLRQKSPALVHRYGPIAVALGALTPIPFSLTCWTAGFLRLPFRSMVGPCLLRIPRYVVYYLVIAGAGQLLGA